MALSISKRPLVLGSKKGICFPELGSSSSFSQISQVSQVANPSDPHGNGLDTLVLAEAITSALIVVSKNTLEKDHHFSLLQLEIEKLRSYTEKMGNEIKVELINTKFDLIKYLVGTLVSVSTVGIAVLLLK